MVDPIDNVRVLEIDGTDVELDPKRLCFTDASLPKFMEELSLWYDYYSSKFAKAEEILANLETRQKTAYFTRFIEGKREVGSDKAAEAFAKTHPEVTALNELVDKAASNVNQMKEYIRALDKAHQMGQNRGHMIRKEMDKLNGNYYNTQSPYESNDTNVADKLDAIFNQ